MASGPTAERPVDLMTSELRYRVRGPLPEEVAQNAESGTMYVRTSFDRLARATLDVSDVGYAVRFAAFKKAWWAWHEVPDVARSFPPGHGAEAARYFNSLALSPGYQGAIHLELDQGEA